MVREGATIAIMDLEMNFCLDKVIIISLLSPMIL